MALNIVESQLKLVLVDAGAKPDLRIDPIGNVVFHLTQGFNAATFPKQQGDALTATLTVPFTGSVGNAEFGFVQIGRANFFGAFYAGRIPSEGSVGVLAHVPPALAKPVMLDAIGTPPMPFFNEIGASVSGQSLKASFGDHPAVKTPLKLRNSGTNVDNFLFHVIDDRDFWTIFTIQEPGTPLRYIAHFRWQVRYDVQFQWRDGKAEAKLTKSFFRVHERNTKGRPSDGDIQGMLNNPSDPRANVAFGDAITKSFFGARGNNRSENPTRFKNVPPDFWG